MDELKQEYVINNFGAKVLLKHTQSFKTFSNESANLEMFLTYILLADYDSKDEIKKYLIDTLCSGQNNIVSEKLSAYLNSDQSNDIFNPKTYEVYFSQMAYTRLTDNALCYFKDVLSEVVRKKPEVLKSSEKESYEYILSFQNMEDLIIDLSEKKIKQLFYGSISDIKKFLRKS